MGRADEDAELGVTIADTPNGQGHEIKDSDVKSWSIRSIAARIGSYALVQWVRVSSIS